MGRGQAWGRRPGGFQALGAFQALDATPKPDSQENASISAEAPTYPHVGVLSPRMLIQPIWQLLRVCGRFRASSPSPWNRSVAISSQFPNRPLISSLGGRIIHGEAGKVSSCCGFLKRRTQEGQQQSGILQVPRSHVSTANIPASSISRTLNL